MNFTLKQLTEFVKENPEAIVYFHPEKTWWTHTSDDFYRLTDEQFSDQMTRLQAVVDGENYPQENRDKAAALIIQANKVRQSGHAIPMAPDQCPLQMMSIRKFLQVNMTRAASLGKYRMANMMAAHAQNCNGVIADKLSEFDNVAALTDSTIEHWSAMDTMRELLYKLTEQKLSKEQVKQGYRPKIIPMIANKIGRNDQCPCGSGKKYKHCHG